LNVDGVGAVRMSRGKLFHAVGPATENARLPSWRLVRGTKRLPRAAEQRAERVATVVTGTLSSFIYDGAGFMTGGPDLSTVSDPIFDFLLVLQLKLVLSAHFPISCLVKTFPIFTVRSP